MTEQIGDLFDPITLDRLDGVAIPTNGERRKDGSAVMGAGMARDAAARWPGLAVSLGNDLSRYGPRATYLGARESGDFFSPAPRIEIGNGRALDHWRLHRAANTILCAVIAVPTKYRWREASSPMLIAKSARELVALANDLRLERVGLPRLGCGLGGLAWSEVRPLLASVLDGRFVVFSR